jgi:hypothetical protein
MSTTQLTKRTNKISSKLYSDQSPKNIKVNPSITPPPTQENLLQQDNSIFPEWKETENSAPVTQITKRYSSQEILQMDWENLYKKMDISEQDKKCAVEYHVLSTLNVFSFEWFYRNKNQEIYTYLDNLKEHLILHNSFTPKNFVTIVNTFVKSFVIEPKKKRGLNDEIKKENEYQMFQSLCLCEICKGSPGNEKIFPLLTEICPIDHRHVRFDDKNREIQCDTYNHLCFHSTCGSKTKRVGKNGLIGRESPQSDETKKSKAKTKVAILPAPLKRAGTDGYVPRDTTFEKLVESTKLSRNVSGLKNMTKSNASNSAPSIQRIESRVSKQRTFVPIAPRIFNQIGTKILQTNKLIENEVTKKPEIPLPSQNQQFGNLTSFSQTNQSDSDDSEFFRILDLWFERIVLGTDNNDLVDSDHETPKFE